MNPERKYQVMFPSLLSQDVSAVVVSVMFLPTEYVNIVESLQRKQNTDDGFVYLSILTKLKR